VTSQTSASQFGIITPEFKKLVWELPHYAKQHTRIQKVTVGAFQLHKAATQTINKKWSQQCKQAWMRSAAHALCNYKSAT
jgi:hypothetical protein